jgi:CO/xanthine dehydrogenase Mo-binding subunit
MNGAGESCITLTVHPDGHINLVEGSADIGGSRASISMMAAEVLGIPAESVHPSVVDTDSVGYTSGTGGSSVTHKAGIAVYQAASDVKLQLLDRVASIWGTDSNSLEMNNGVISSTSNQNLKISFEDLAAQLNDTGGPIVGRAALTTRGPGGAFAGHIIDVEVDPETGKVAILRCTAFQDCGKAIHPSYVEGQMQGGTVQGIGWALNEEYFMNEDGSMANGTFLDYRMPLALDLPMIDTVIVEVANPDHPFGVRGVGEVSIAPPLPAVANAVYGATGIRMSRLPMTPASIANITK